MEVLLGKGILDTSTLVWENRSHFAMPPLAVVDPGEGPPLFLDQIEARRAGKIFLKTGAPLYQGLDDRAPPLIWRSRSATDWFLTGSSSQMTPKEWAQKFCDDLSLARSGCSFLQWFLSETSGGVAKCHLYSLATLDTCSVVHPWSPNSDRHPISPNNTLPDQTDRSWELTEWSPKMKCCDVRTNSLKQYHKECMKNSVEMMHVDAGA